MTRLNTDYPELADLADSLDLTANANRLLRQMAAAQSAESRAEAAFAEALLGEGDFWPSGDWSKATDSPRWDNEQQCAIMVAVRDALRGEFPPATRWLKVWDVICTQAMLYAAAKGEEARP